MASEDASTILAEFVSSLENLPLEVAHIMAEIAAKESQLADLRVKADTREINIARHHKANGLLIANPKEPTLVHKMRIDMRKMQELSDDKVKLAERAFNLITRHSNRFERELAKLNGGVPPPIVPLASLPSTPAVPISPYQAVHTALHNATHTAPAVSYAPAYVTSASDRSLKRKNTPTLNSPLPSVYTAPAPPQTSLPTPVPTPSVNLAGMHAQLSARPQRPSRLSTSFGHPGAGSPSNSDVESSNRMGVDTPRSAMPPVSAASISTQGRDKRSHKKHNKPLTPQPPSSATSARRPVLEADEDEDAEGEDDDGEGESFDNDYSGGGGDETTLYCYCQRVSFGQMVGCDNPACPHEWFHFECAGLKSQPEGAWYCRDCVEGMSGGGRRTRK